MIEALVFDAYGTLFDVYSVSARCEQSWPGKGADVARLWRAKQLEYTWQRSLMRRYVPFSQVTREALAFACESLKLPLDDRTTNLLMEEYLRLATFSDVSTCLKKNGDKKLAILTNGSPDMIDPLVKHSGLRFDAVLSVDEAKIYKPAPEVYALAVARLGMAKEKIGFVSSNGWDAAGAKAFGFNVYWINRGGVPAERLGLRPDQTLKGLDEILR